MPSPYAVPAGQLRCLCDPGMFSFTSTAELEPLDEVIGQKRAVQAITFGLNMQSPGYNIFVTGQEGTGKTTITRDLVSHHARGMPAPVDWCMVNNFKDEYRPRAIIVPCGGAARLAKRMHRLIEDLKERLGKEFESESYQEKLTELKTKFGEQKRELLEKLEKFALERQIQMSRTPSGFQPIPTADGKPMTPEQFQELSEDRRAEIEKRVREVQLETEATLREMNKLNQAFQKESDELGEKIALFIVRDRMDLLREEYRQCPDVLNHLDEVQADIVENVEIFTGTPEGDAAKAAVPGMPVPKVTLDRYKVNVLVDRSGDAGAPVIFEPNPTYQNVFGRIEKKAFMGAVTTDFSLVQAGSLLQANGGYLIMEMESVLMNPYVWEALKRALQNKRLYIEDVAVGLGIATASLRPEPIPLTVKVILLGNPHLFHLLQNHDSKFNKIFKVRADFDSEVGRTADTIQLYARFIARVCAEERLLPFSPCGVSAIVEYGEKHIAHKEKLSLRFGSIVGIIKEADYCARQEGAAQVTEAHVITAFNEFRFRHNLYEEKIHENYVDNTIMIDVAGQEVGQVNALAVYQMGEISFGRPSRITAETFMGRRGIINIEREAKLSGRTHDKGVLILSGFMGRTFAQKHPLSLNISVTFEQSYGGIDGDSASSTELYAILSSLADLPIRQGIAVTGSVNQKGQIQAIGGANQKIEGFYDVCKAKGLTGDQGVMIPRANVKNLMLKREVVEAVENGRFQVFQVASVAEGIEILTGVTAGEPDAHGDFPADTVFGRVQAKLRTYMEHTMRLRKTFEEGAAPENGAAG